MHAIPTELSDIKKNRNSRPDLARASARERIPEANIARGVAMSIVIIGHAVSIVRHNMVHSATGEVHGLIEFTYRFLFIPTIPLFVFLTGLILAHTQIQIKSPAQFYAFVAKKAQRILVPYFSYSLLVLFPKFILRDFVYHQPDEQISAFLLSSLQAIFLYPTHNPMGVLWFLHTLFFLYLLAPIFMWMTDRVGGLITLLVILSLSFVQEIEILNTEELLNYLFYFHCGYVFHANRRVYVAKLMKLPFLWISLSIALMCASIAFLPDEPDNVLNHIIRTCVRLTSVIGAYTFARVLAEKWNFIARQLDLFGSHSYDIYLNGHLIQVSLRMLTLGLMITHPILTWFILAFVPLYVPIPLSRYILSRNRLSATLLQGASWTRRPEPMPQSPSA